MLATEIKGPKGKNARNGHCKFPDKVARRERAKERQAAYDILTNEQKLARLQKQLDEGSIPGQAKKQLARLMLEVTGDKNLAAQQTPEAKAAVKKLFTATPKQLGEAAVKAARPTPSAILLESNPAEVERRRQRAERWAQKKGSKKVQK